jgi:hypothetical protein
MRAILALIVAAGMSLFANAGPVKPVEKATPAVDRKTLLAEIEQGCVATDKSGDSQKIVEAKCKCVKEMHSKSTPSAALQVISDHYNERKNFDTPDISDEESLALDIFHEVHGTCKAKTQEKR